MSQSGELGALLDLLFKDEPVDAQGFRQSADPDGFATILGEISQTLLPAQLTFRTGTGHSLRVLASNRRLCAVLDLPPGAQAADFADLVAGAPLANTAETAANAAALLHAFCSGSDGIAIRSELRAEADPGSAKGITAAALQDHATQVAPAPKRDPTAAVADFLAPVMDHAGRWVMFENGALAGHSDAAPDPDLLCAIAALQDPAQTGFHGPDPCLLVQGPTGAEPHCAVFAWSDDWVFGASAVRRTNTDLIEAWRRLGL